MDAMDKHGFRGTVNLNSDVCREYPQIISEGNARKWEWEHRETTTRASYTDAGGGGAKLYPAQCQDH